MGSVAYIEEERRELAKDVHRLARLRVRLMSISYGGVTVQNGAESSLVVETRLQIFGVAGGIHEHHPWTVGGPTVHPAGPWFVSTNSPRTQPEIRPSVDPRSDLRSVGQVMGRGSFPWIDAPKAQLQSQLTVDQHGPSFDAQSVGLTVGEGRTQLDENCDWVNFK
ncbi:hypothetical protein MTR67_025702 [Solanum verrucosum]|uniref:Uncharacterized protein n=1 Tax=Solanum verrucosum TaxID=315347 RepID=A0AAF0TTA9_SOLVR|nr:hypothetical protein MTR67_025702 [Solanum verrucosum]